MAAGALGFDRWLRWGAGDAGGGATTGGAVSASSVTGGAAGVLLELVSAPPELRTMTVGPVVLVVVVSDGDVPSVLVSPAAVWLPVFVEAETLDEGGVETDDSADAALVVFAPVALFVLVVLADEVVDASPLLVDDSPSEDGLAHAMAGELATAIPTPNATASAPTRPIYEEQFGRGGAMHGLARNRAIGECADISTSD